MTDNLPVWIFVFIFQGQPMASGPHELEQCLLLAQTQRELHANVYGGSFVPHCWNPKTQERKTHRYQGRK